MFWARDAVWATGKWKTPQLDEFIKSVNPDIIFQPIYYSSFVDEVGLYAKKLTELQWLDIFRMIAIHCDNFLCLRYFG